LPPRENSIAIIIIIIINNNNNNNNNTSHYAIFNILCNHNKVNIEGRNLDKILYEDEK